MGCYYSAPSDTRLEYPVLDVFVYRYIESGLLTVLFFGYTDPASPAPSLGDIFFMAHMNRE
jgi:hypothetical protein